MKVLKFFGSRDHEPLIPTPEVKFSKVSCGPSKSV